MQWWTEAGKIPKYRIPKLRYSNRTEPNNTEPNHIVYENKGILLLYIFYCIFMQHFFSYLFVVTRFQWLFWFRKNVEILKIVIFLSKNGLKDP